VSPQSAAGLAQSDYGRLRRVALKHARAAFRDHANVAAQWRELGFTSAPEFDRAVAEYDAFEAVLTARGVAIEHMPEDDRLSLDSMYVRDASVMSERGAILCNMGKRARHDEPRAQRRLYERLGIPIAGVIEPPGTLEGGDVAWLDSRTVAVGHGYRTNAAGIEQLRDLLADAVDELIVVPLPHHRGPADVFHLMSIVSPVGPDLALVYSPLMPVPFRETLLARGFDLVEVPDEEFDTLGCNSLALAPRACLLASGNPRTKRRLERAGVEVTEFAGAEIAVKGGGGPTCLTRPLEWRLDGGPARRR
jgi:N-dimethylarginine dimethylaminohydrolase